MDASQFATVKDDQRDNFDIAESVSGETPQGVLVQPSRHFQYVHGNDAPPTLFRSVSPIDACGAHTNQRGHFYCTGNFARRLLRHGQTLPRPGHRREDQFHLLVQREVTRGKRSMPAHHRERTKWCETPTASFDRRGTDCVRVLRARVHPSCREPTSDS